MLHCILRFVGELWLVMAVGTIGYSMIALYRDGKRDLGSFLIGAAVATAGAPWAFYQILKTEKVW